MPLQLTVEFPETLLDALQTTRRWFVNSLARGEAAVIQIALVAGIHTVCIDESMGRRVARLHNLSLTGSIGILLKAKRSGYPLSMREAIQNMRSRGIWLSRKVADFALLHAGEVD